MAAKPKTQLQRFKEAARAIGTDDDVGRFEARLGRLKLTKPPQKPKPKKIAK